MGIEEGLASQARLNREAYGELFDIYSDFIYDYAYHINGSEEAAESMTEKIFYQVLEDIDSNRYIVEEGSFHIWFYRRVLSTPQPQEEYDDVVENGFTPFDYETRKILWIIYRSRLDKGSILEILNVDETELERIKDEACSKVL